MLTYLLWVVSVFKSFMFDVFFFKSVCVAVILLCREGEFHHKPVLFKQNTLSNLEVKNSSVELTFWKLKTILCV